jgi:hypothetical protein
MMIEMEILEVEIRKEYPSYNEALNHMLSQGVKHVGWANDHNVKIPDVEYTQVFADWTGKSCLYVSRVHRIAYSVDMGD